MSGNLLKLHVFLGFEPFSLPNREAEWRLVGPLPHVCRFKWLVQLTLLSEFEFTEHCLAKINERKTNKNARFSWFWAFFAIKNWSIVEGSNSKTSNLGPNGWYNWLGCQNEFECTDVSKNLSGKLIKVQVFLGFEHFLLSGSEAERRIAVATPRV